MTPRPKKINGAEMIGERRWSDSPAVADLIATLCDLGLDVDPTPKVGVDWPSPDRKVRDAFHARWTERMQQRCGFDPLRPTNYGTIRQERTEKRAAKMREVAALHEDGKTVPEIAEAVGSDVRTVREWFKKLGIRERRVAVKRGRPFNYDPDA